MGARGCSSGVFLRGLRNNRAAFEILEKEPKSLGDAIKLVQRCEAHQVLLGGELKVRQTQETGDPSGTAMVAQEGGLDLGGQMGGTLARITGGGKKPGGEEGGVWELCVERTAAELLCD